MSNFVITDNLFSAWARSGNLFSCGIGSGKFIFVHGKPQSTEVHVITVLETVRDVIERSSMGWNY